MRRLELSNSTSHKFWQIELRGKSIAVAWGKIGTRGQTQKRIFPTAAIAVAQHDKLLGTKLRKGYVEVPLAAAEPLSRVKRSSVPTPASALVSDVLARNSKLRSIRIALAATIYYSRDGSASARKRKAILACFERFIALFGDDLNYFRIDGTSFEWDGKSRARAFGTVRRKLSRPGNYGEYGFHFAREDADATPTELGVFADHHFAYSSSCFGFIVPVATLAERLGDVEAYFRGCCEALDADQGYAGLALTDRAHYYFDGSRNYDSARRREVVRSLEACPLLDCHVWDLGLPDLQYPVNFPDEANDDPARVHWGLRWPSWMNFVGNEWIAKLGGRRKLERDLSSLDTIASKKGLTVRAGELPSLGAAPTRLMRTLGKVTAPVRLRADYQSRAADPTRGMSRPGGNWIKRFDR